MSIEKKRERVFIDPPMVSADRNITDLKISDRNQLMEAAILLKENPDDIYPSLVTITKNANVERELGIGFTLLISAVFVQYAQSTGAPVDMLINTFLLSGVSMIGLAMGRKYLW